MSMSAGNLVGIPRPSGSIGGNVYGQFGQQAKNGRAVTGFIVNKPSGGQPIVNSTVFNEVRHHIKVDYQVDPKQIPQSIFDQICSEGVDIKKISDFFASEMILSEEVLEQAPSLVEGSIKDACIGTIDNYISELVNKFMDSYFEQHSIKLGEEIEEAVYESTLEKVERCFHRKLVDLLYSKVTDKIQ